MYNMMDFNRDSLYVEIEQVVFENEHFFEYYVIYFTDLVSIMVMA